MKFSDIEKMILMSLIDEYKHVVENPQTDGPSLECKKNAWKLIIDQYNVAAEKQGFYKKTEKQLRKCWENLKQRCRREDSRKKHYELQTGGGPALEDHSDEEMNERVRGIVPHINYTLENAWDSTGSLETSNEDLNDGIASSKNNVHGAAKKLIANVQKSRFNEKNPNVDQRKSNKRSRILESTENSFNMDDEIGTGTSTPNGSKKRTAKCLDDVNDMLPQKKNRIPTAAEIEQDARIKKVEDSCMHQIELHQQKMKAVIEETKYWETMNRAAELSHKVREAELQAMQMQILYWKNQTQAGNGLL